jgi:hypothetical protein
MQGDTPAPEPAAMTKSSTLSQASVRYFSLGVNNVLARISHAKSLRSATLQQQ